MSTLLWKEWVFCQRTSWICLKCLNNSRLFGLTQFLKYSVLFVIKDLILLLIQGGSLSLMVAISLGIKLLMILRIDFVRVEAFIWECLISVKTLNGLRNYFDICIFVMPNMSFIRGKIKRF